MIVIAFVPLFASLSTLAMAQDDRHADAMLEALKERGYLELADHYLDGLHESALVSDQWKRKIPFARASLIIQFAATSASDDVDDRLKEATDLLKQFVEQNPGEPIADDASMELAKLKMAEGHRAVAQAAAQEDEAARDRLLEQAGTAFRSAEMKFRQRKNVLADQLKVVQESPAAQDDQASLDKMRGDYLFARMTVALLEYEQAKLVQDDPKEFQEQLQAALKEFGNLSKEFRERLIGLEAIHYQGRCHQDLGDLETALDYYEQLMQLTELPQSLMTRTLARVVECYVKLGRPARAITLGEAWLARGGDRLQSSEAAETVVSIAEAYIAEAQRQSGRQQQRNYDQARQQLLRASRIPGRPQTRAEALLTTLPAALVEEVDPAEIGDFETAKRAAEQSRDQLQATQSLVDLQRRKVETIEDEERRAAAQAELRASQQNLQRFQATALSHYRHALTLAHAGVPADDLNEVRTMVAYLNYQMSRYMEAAAIAEFIALRVPDAKSAKECANIAMASYWNLYQQAAEGDKAFETARMMRIAEVIVSRWPGESEAEAALVNLVNLSVSQADAAKAEEYLSRIPLDSPARLAAELRTGAGLCHLWLKQSRQALDGEEPDEVLLARAESLLAGALEKSRDKTPDAAVLHAALALAQLQIETGRSLEAVALLRDKKIGPKTLVDQQHASATSPGFVEQTYRSLLKALIGQLAEEQVSPAETIGEANATMDALKEIVGDSPEGQQRLIATYVALAKDLRQQIDGAAPETKEKLRRGFVAFLDRVAETSNTVTTRHWVAATYLGMANDIAGTDAAATVPAGARPFYEHALETFAALLQLPDDTAGMSPAVRTQLRLQMASANRRLGNHKEAVDLFEEVLKQRDTIINVQVEAALTLQEAGSVGSNNLYELAIRGARRNAENVNTIWGWQRLAQAAAGQMKKGPKEEAQFSDLFFQSRFHIAQCRYLQAQRSAGEEQAKYLQQATRAIKLTRSLYPEMGGEAWKTRFDELADKIEALAGD